MKWLRKLFADRLYRFYTALILSWVLLLLGCAMLFLWSCFPENDLLFACAAIAGVWMAATIFLVDYRTISRYIRPLYQIEDYAGQVARGEFPPPLNLAGRNADCYRDLIRSLNQMRDRLRHYSSHYAQMQQRGQEKMRDSHQTAELHTKILATLAPDLRGPLNAIRGYSHLLEHEPDSPHRQEWLERLNRSIGDAEMLLERMVDIGGLAGSPDRDPQKCTFETAEFIRRLIDSASKMLRDRNVALTTRFPADLPASLHVDRDQLRQLLTILLRVIGMNAAPGDSVEFSCDREGHDVRFRIRDAGCRHHRTTLAELYGQYLDGSIQASSHAGSELGLLGLLFVDAQSLALNAQLDVATFDEDGTELLLTMHDAVDEQRPHAAPTIHMTGTDANKAVRPRTAPDAVATGSGMPLHILLVDYDRDLSVILKYLLPEAKLTFYQGIESLPEACSLQEFDVLLLEIVPRRELQRETVEQFMRNALVAGLPVIVLLSAPAPELEHQLLLAGVTRTMVKPLNFAELQQQLQQLAPRTRA